MMKKYLLSFSCVLALVYSTQAQKRVVGSVGFYNVENLFDLEDGENRDEEYLVGGERGWTFERYQEKLTNLSKVLSTMAKGADIIGLSEVENRKVVQDLTYTPALKRFKYQIVHKDSPDRRGIDVALIYKEDKFKVVHTNWVKYPDPEYITRDILVCTGVFLGDTITLAVNHWPSRRSGPEKRNAAGAKLREVVDSLQARHSNAKVFLMGDFNDDPRNASVKKELGAVGNKKKLEENGLFNASTFLFKQNIGSLSYRGAWNMFDQIIVSEAAVSGLGLTMKPNSFSVFGPGWMRQTEGQYAGSPLRTFGGKKYLAGYSDHFPVYILLEK